MLEEIAYETIRNFVFDNYPKIKVSPGECVYNFRCHLNAVHHAIRNGHHHVAMVIYISKNSNKPSIHFVNINKEGKYTDNTVGEWSANFDYYLVSYIEKYRFFHIESEFTNYRKTLMKVPDPFIRFVANYSV